MVSISFHIEKIIFQGHSYPTEHANIPETQAVCTVRTFANSTRDLQKHALQNTG